MKLMLLLFWTMLSCIASSPCIETEYQEDSFYECVDSNKPISKKEQRLRSAIVKSARKYVGSKYKYGGTSPKGFDCSGFVTYVLGHYGYDGGRSSGMLAKKGLHVGKYDIKEGDLIFFGHNNKITHVAIATEVSKRNISMIHSTSSRGVIEEDLLLSQYWQSRFMFARNIISK